MVRQDHGQQIQHRQFQQTDEQVVPAVYSADKVLHIQGIHHKYADDRQHPGRRQQNGQIRQNNSRAVLPAASAQENSVTSLALSVGNSAYPKQAVR